jgi:hypothetical protein
MVMFVGREHSALAAKRLTNGHHRLINSPVCAGLWKSQLTTVLETLGNRSKPGAQSAHCGCVALQRLRNEQANVVQEREEM